MSVRIKVYGGTPPSEDVCQECKHFRYIRGHRQGDEIRRCHAIGEPIRFPVAQCSYFQRKDASVPAGAYPLHFDTSRGKLLIDINPSFFGETWVTVEEFRGQKEPEPGPLPEVVQ